MTFQKQHAKVVRLELSIGNADADRTIEQFEAAIRKALSKIANHATIQGSYYIIDGKVCLPADYDPEQKDRKPGTHPPPWAGGPQPSNVRETYPEAESETPREFVRVQSTATRRDPITGIKPRRTRSDKGVKRGPRQAKDVA